MKSNGTKRPTCLSLAAASAGRRSAIRGNRRQRREGPAARKGRYDARPGRQPFSAGRVLWTDDEHAEGFRQYLYELRGEMDNTPDAVLDAFAEGIHENRTWIESLPDFNADDVNFSEHFQKGCPAKPLPRIRRGFRTATTLACFISRVKNSTT